MFNLFDFPADGRGREIAWLKHQETMEGTGIYPTTTVMVASGTSSATWGEGDRDS
jgi:hypothetical protein